MFLMKMLVSYRTNWSGRLQCWDTEHTLTIPLWFFFCLCYIYQGNIQFISFIKNVYISRCPVKLLLSRTTAQYIWHLLYIIFTGIYRDLNVQTIFFNKVLCKTLYWMFVCVTPPNHGLNNYEIFSEKILHSWGAIYNLYDYIFL